MKSIGELKAYGYGICLFSPEKFNEFMNSRKCKAKKYLSYFDKHKDLFFDLIKEGIFVPFYRICCFEYEIFIAVDKPNVTIPTGYREIYHYEDFYVKIGNDKLCFSNFDYLEYQKDKISSGQSDYGEEIPTGVEETLEWYNYAIGLDLESGEYQFDLYGLERIEPLERESKNCGFLFSFRKVSSPIKDNLEKCDNDKYVFDIAK